MENSKAQYTVHYLLLLHFALQTNYILQIKYNTILNLYKPLLVTEAIIFANLL